jgi:hypothetical protein
MGNLNYPLSPEDQRILLDNLAKQAPQVVFDTTWSKVFQYLTLFESLDGFTVTGASSVLSGTQLDVKTAASLNNVAEITKAPAIQGLITFSQRSNMRTAINLSSVTNVTAYVLVGNSTSFNYGFKIVNGTLYGVTNDNATENAVNLGTLQVATGYNLEARYTPGDRVVFYLNSVVVGNSTANLPLTDFSGTGAVANPNLMDFYLKTTDGNAKTMSVSFFQYSQLRNVQ